MFDFSGNFERTYPPRARGVAEPGAAEFVVRRLSPSVAWYRCAAGRPFLTARHLPAETASMQLVFYPSGMDAHVEYMDGQAIKVGGGEAGSLRLVDMAEDRDLNCVVTSPSRHLILRQSVIDEVIAFLGRSVLSSGEWRRDQPFSDPILATLLNIIDEADAPADEMDRVFSDKILAAVIAHLVKNYCSEEGAGQGHTGLSVSQERRAKAFLLSRISENVSLGEVAQACDLSPGHFGELFRRTTGKSPFHWLRDQRLAMSLRLMRGSDMSLSELALACGFASQSHFTRLFSAAHGVSPGQWRKTNGADDVGRRAA